MSESDDNENSSKLGLLSDDNIEFRTVAEYAPVMLWLTNVEGENIFANGRWRSFIGSEKLNKLGGQAWLEALHPSDKQKCLNTFKQAFQNHRHFEMEYRLKRRDGEWRFIRDCGEPYIDKEGKFSGFIGSSTDITERKVHEEKVRISYQELSQHNKEMTVINKLNTYLQACRTLDETFPVIAHYAGKIFPDCPGALYLFNENRTLVESVAKWGRFKAPSQAIINSDDCWSLRQGKPHTAENSEEILNCKHLSKKLEHGYTCVPIIAQGDILGMLHLQFPNLNTYVAGDDRERKIESRQRLVNITADNLALSLMSLKLREALKSQSIRDPLTNLFNRRYMEENLEREISRCERKNSSLAMMVLDIDHFKQVNDNYGHDIGDLAIKTIADYLSEQFRESDMVCRFGGEEFLVIMPEIGINLAERRAEELRQGIKELTIRTNSISLDPITVSIGIALLPTHGHNSKDLFIAADSALYEAKESGRDQVKISSSILPKRQSLFNLKSEKNLKATNTSEI